MPFGIGDIISIGTTLLGGVLGGGSTAAAGPAAGGSKARAEIARLRGKLVAMRSAPARSLVAPVAAAVPSSFTLAMAARPPPRVIAEAAGAATAVGATAWGLFGNGGPRTIGQILAEARENSGRSVTSKAIRAAARSCGLEMAAEMFGISIEDVCFIVINVPRRRRGISAADISRTRSTIRKIATIQHSFQHMAKGCGRDARGRFK